VKKIFTIDKQYYNAIAMTAKGIDAQTLTGISPR